MGIIIDVSFSKSSKFTTVHADASVIPTPRRRRRRWISPQCNQLRLFMSFKRQMCYLAVPRQLKSHPDQLGITEDILSNVIWRDTLSEFSRRHGSSVPGPLEARRRAAKRRLMNLASPAAAGVIEQSFQPGVNSGLATGWQWQTPSIPASQEPVLQVEDGTHILSQSIKQMLI